VKPVLLFSSPILAVMAVVLGVLVILVPDSATPALASSCLPDAPVVVDDIHLDSEQWQVAREVIKAGQSDRVPSRGWVVALAAAYQESGLRPLPYGDRDSLGVFQQRTAWGPASVRMDPYESAHMFFTGGRGGQPGLLDVANWQQMPVTVAAQTVQVSAYPDAYAAWEPLAVQLVAAIGNVDPTCGTGSWVFPLNGTPYVETAGFGECGSHWSHCHTGQDFAAPVGSPVLAAGAGTVIFAAWDGAYGNAIHLLHADGVATWYAHLSRIDIVPGNTLAAGERIGLSGDTGNTTGPHLHLEVRLGASTTTAGEPIDPLPWLRNHHLI